MNRVLALPKNKWSLKVAGLGLASSLLVAGVAAAVSQNTQSPVTVPPDPETVTTQAERVIQRETAYKAQMPSISTAKIISKCAAAHSVVNKVAAEDDASYSTRLATYDQLANQLSDDINKLKDRGITNSDLNSAAQGYYKAVNAYLNDHSNFKTAIDDLSTIDCTKDPTGFEASLFDARKLRQQMATDAVNIKSYIKPVQTTIVTVKLQLNGGAQ